MPAMTPPKPPRRLLRFLAGWLLVGVGAVLAPTPLPLGLPLVAAGLYLLARDSAAVRRAIRDRRRTLPGLSRGLNGIKQRMPAGVRRMIETTDPTAAVPQEE